MRLSVLILNIMLCILGFLFHVSTYFYIDFTKYTFLINLFFLGVLLFGFGLVVLLIFRFKLKGKEFTPLGALKSLPFLTRISIVVFIFVASIISFYHDTFLLGGGTTIIDGKYYIAANIGIIKALSKDEYLKLQVIELRSNTAMFLLLNYITTISYFYLLKKRKQ